MSWGDGSGVPTSENDLVIVGTDNNSQLHIRIFDQGGNPVTYTIVDETKLPPAQTQAILTLKQQLPGLLPPYVLTDAQNAQVLREATSIVGQTLTLDRSPKQMRAWFKRAASWVTSLARRLGDLSGRSRGFDLRLMSWGDGSGVPTSENDLVIVGTDNNSQLHIRIFDQGGNPVTYTIVDETKLPPAQTQAILTLKQQLPDLLPPHVLTDAEKAQVLREATSIVRQTRSR